MYHLEILEDPKYKYTHFCLTYAYILILPEVRKLTALFDISRFKR
jgi:hypothetical protein